MNRHIYAVEPIFDHAVKSGRAFFLGASQAATANEYSHIQLFNPSGSGVEVYIDSVEVGVSATGAVYKNIYNTALGTQVGNGVNKDAGSSASSAIMYKDTDLSVLGGTTGVFVISATGQPVDLVNNHPIRLSEGEGFLIVRGGVNNDLFATFGWREYS